MIDLSSFRPFEGPSAVALVMTSDLDITAGLSSITWMNADFYDIGLNYIKVEIVSTEYPRMNGLPVMIAIYLKSDGRKAPKAGNSDKKTE